MYACLCHAVTEADVHAAVAEGHRCVESVAAATGASTGCGGCTERLCALVELAGRTSALAS